MIHASLGQELKINVPPLIMLINERERLCAIAGQPLLLLLLPMAMARERRGFHASNDVPPMPEIAYVVAISNRAVTTDTDL